MGSILRKFIKLESGGGIVLFITAILALILDNTPWYTYYEALLNLPLNIQLGPFQLSKPLLLWINDGLMTVFFLLVGLEIKREMLEGKLNDFAQASLPVIAGLGGMFIPALIYFAFNIGEGT
ncbi:MAG: Na+/H+ antiporter NhaA, partial [Coxiella endosymbiont of Dermacentor silvarum]